MPVEYPVDQFIYDAMITFNQFLPYVLIGGPVIGILNWVVGGFIRIFNFKDF